MHSNFISEKAYTSSCTALFYQPYKEGISNFKVSSSQGISAFSQLKHLSAGVALTIPLINTLVFLILRKTCSQPKVPDQNKKIEAFKLLEDKKSFDNPLKKSIPQKVKESLIEKEKSKNAPLPPKKTQKIFYAPSRDYYREWDVYLRHQRIKGIPTEHQSWHSLPSEDLLLFLTNDKKKVLEVPLKLFRDAALSYQSIGEKIVLIDNIWDRFTGHIEYLEDIFNASPNAALLFVTSARVKETLKENLHRTIILSASNPILEQLEKDTIKLSTMQKFVYFCMIYRPVVPQDVFKKVQTIQQKVREKAAAHPEKEDLKKFLIIIDLLVERYELQGIISHESDKPTNFDTPCSCYLLDTHWAEISHHFTKEAQKDENFEKKLAYFSLLSMVPKSKPYYANARRVLGNIARALGDFDHSELYFTEAESYS